MADEDLYSSAFEKDFFVNAITDFENIDFDKMSDGECLKLFILTAEWGTNVKKLRIKYPKKTETDTMAELRKALEDEHAE